MRPSDLLIEAKNAASDVYASVQQATGALDQVGSIVVGEELQWAYRNWVGVSVGLRPGAGTNSEDDFELSLCFATAPPFAEDLLRAALNTVLPPPLPGIEFAVQVTGWYKPLAAAAALSIGVETTTETGTLGAIIVRDTARDKRLLLSNNHVLFGNGLLLHGGGNKLICSPPPALDPHIHQNEVGRVSVFPAECQLAPRPQKNSGDYGFGDVTKPDRVPVRTASGMPPLTTEKPIAPEDAIGKTVKKVGARTNVTTGTVRSINHDFLLHYDSMNATFRFGDQLVIESNTPGQLFADAGDSGSLVVTEAGEAVGIVFAGSDAQTIASPLKDLFDVLGLSFVLP